MSDLPHMLTETEMRYELQRRCVEAGSQRAIARAFGLSEGQLSSMLSGREGITDSVVNAMGYSGGKRYWRVVA
jgi:hypothetical protein